MFAVNSAVPITTVIAGDSVAMASSAVSNLVAFLAAVLAPLADFFQKIPGSSIVVRYVMSSYKNDPVRSMLELVLFLFAVHYMLNPKTRTPEPSPTKDEIEDLLEEWEPVPLAAPLTEGEELDLKSIPIISRYPPGKAIVKKADEESHYEVINLGSDDCYNLASSDLLKEAAAASVRKYGVGPCGPPNFYATQDVHKKVEEDIARHIGADACIIYAQQFSTISAVVPAFCKRGDMIVADCAINSSAFKGIQLSRSNISWYKHNDMADLEKRLASIAEAQKRKKILTRRFIITEGLFETTGNLCDLPKIISLAKKYKFRTILDEKNTYGLLGANGRGITEELGVDPKDVDMIIGSMSGVISSAGGFCVASREIIEHQRLNAASYCFSAALPAMMAAATSSVIEHVLTKPEGAALSEKLLRNVSVFRESVGKLSNPLCPAECLGWEKNPAVLVSLSAKVLEAHRLTGDDLEYFFNRVARECLSRGLLVSHTRDMPNPPSTRESDIIKDSRNNWRPAAAVRVRISAANSAAEMERAAHVLTDSFAKVLAEL